MPEPLVYLNGRLLPFSQAGLPLHDAGFVSGATVVDNARTYGRRLFRWPQHLARFRRDCAACFVPLEATDEALTAAAEELVAHNAALLPPGGELQLVTFATPGPLGFYRGEVTDGPPTLGLLTYPLPVGRYRRFLAQGVRLAVAGFQPLSADSLLPPTWKHRSRLIWHLAERRLRACGAPPDVVPILTDAPGGNLTETALANFGAVIDGVLTFPPPGTVLDGVSEAVTRELCDSLGIPWRFAPVPLADVPRMSEAILTGTGFGVAAVRELHTGGWDGSSGTGLDWPGPVYRRLLTAWSELVGIDLAASLGA
jgi:branched-subunit amino acid aminotransferase/4-amino-4-deoxychorismate lyase